MDEKRRAFLQGSLAAAIGLGSGLIGTTRLEGQPAEIATRPIPSTGEQIPIVGLGTWVTFNVGNDPELLEECAAVMAAFFKAGGRMIDSSPMYASSQPTIGYGLKKLGYPPVFAAEKVWTSRPGNGPAQIEQTRAYWGIPKLDLVQVHNLLAWEEHRETLFAMKAEGKIRYVGITTSEGRRHREFERVMATQPLDFIQVTYNVLDREVESRILPLAQERGIGVIINRPFRQKELIRHVERHPLPPWLAETGASTWPQLLLKFIISHPAVTCVIPATTRVDHVLENMAAGSGLFPDEVVRQRISDYVRQL